VDGQLDANRDFLVTASTDQMSSRITPSAPRRDPHLDDGQHARPALSDTAGPVLSQLGGSQGQDAGGDAFAARGGVQAGVNRQFGPGAAGVHIVDRDLPASRLGGSPALLVARLPGPGRSQLGRTSHRPVKCSNPGGSPGSCTSMINLLHIPDWHLALLRAGHGRYA